MAELYIGENQIGGGGSADLSNYYNKSEIDSSFGETYLVKISNANGQYYYVPRTMSDADKQAILSRANSSSGAIIFDNPENSSDNIFGSGAIMIGNSYAKGTKAIALGYKTEAIGNYTHSEGYGTKATYSASHAEGYFTTASGAYSHTEGNNTTASGRNAHAEGSFTTASNENSHAEGYSSIAAGMSSHAEGGNTYTSGQYSHAEGSDASAMNYASHAEGYYTKASGQASHAEGYYTVAQKQYQHVEGQYNADASNAIHITGNGTINGRHNALEVHLSGDIKIPDTHASGNEYQKPMFVLQDKLYQIDSSIAALEANSSGGGSSSDFNYVIIDGSNNLIRNTISSEDQTYINNHLNYTENAIVFSTPPRDNDDYNYGDNSISLGAESQGVGVGTLAHGYHVIAYSGYSHAEGYSSIAAGMSSHAEGNSTNATGNYSHAEGNSTNARGESSHAEGKDTSAYGDYSHAEGTQTSATGNYSHAEGRLSVASGLYSHAEGGITEANQNYQHVEGTCNLTVTNALHIIGNGTSRQNKHNAFEVHKSGEIFISDTYASGEVYEKPMYVLQDKLYQIDSSIAALEANSGGGSADLSNYYNKSEIDSSFADTYLVKITNASGYYCYVPRTMSAADRQTVLSKLNTNGGIVKDAINSVFVGKNSHQEGWNCKASGDTAHAEGYQTTASGKESHAEGSFTTASGDYSHAEGSSTTASGDYSHAEGRSTTASANYSHAEGYYTAAKQAYQHVEGIYNADASTAVLLIGNGDSSTSRHNALEVHTSGEVKISDTYASGAVYEKPMFVLQDRLYQIDSSINNINANINYISTAVLSNVNFVVMNEVDYELITPDPSIIYFLT